jgi:transcriptional regulator with XRE-family HTH domain
MSFLRIKGKQVAAARALAGLTAAQLAERAGLTRLQITRIENGAAQPREGTLSDIVRAFEEISIEFTERGVRWADDVIKTVEGEDAYLRMLDDVYYVTHKKGGEVLFLYSSDQFSTQGEHDAEIRIRNARVRFRSIIAEGKTDTVWPRTEYRQIPKKYFHHNLQVIYADKVAQVIDGGERIIIIRNQSFAQTARNTFDLIWSQSKPPPAPSRRHEK